MPNERIPFVNQQESGWDALGGASPQAMNVVIDGRGTVRRRPGVATYDRAPTTVIDANGIDGVHITNGRKLYVAGGVVGSTRPLYRLTGAGTNELGGVQPLLRGMERPIFAETEALVVIAAGRNIQKIDLTTDTSERLGGDPPESTHIIANNSRLLVRNLEIEGQINFSDQAIGQVIDGHEVWTLGVGLAGFFQAEARPDPLLSIAENTNEVFAFGRTNVQTFSPDPEITYATVSTREFGCAAPYSVIKLDQSFAWLDHHRRFILSDGRSFTEISDPVDAYLDGITNVSDCHGYRVHEGQIDCMVWTFPTDGRTLCYQQDGGWSQWQGWDDGTNNWKQFMVTAHGHDNVDAKNVVGTVDGKVGILERGQNTDLGERINAFVTTGFIERKSDRRKHTKSVRFVFQRGATTSSTAPQARFRWRDDEGDWEDWIEINLGSAGQRQPVVEFRSVGGPYRRRQWAFEFSDDEELVLASATEEFDVLDN